MSEPEIIINGTKLTDGQAMTIRVACNAFAIDLCANGLGDDEHGKVMTRLYLERLHEVALLLGKPQQ